MAVGCHRHAPATLPAGRAPVPIEGGWVGPRAGLKGFWWKGNSLLPSSFELRTVRSVDYAIPAPAFGADTQFESRPKHSRFRLRDFA
jgi:hypothetical protein